MLHLEHLRRLDVLSEVSGFDEPIEDRSRQGIVEMGYPVSVGSFAFSHPAMPSGITKTSR